MTKSDKNNYYFANVGLLRCAFVLLNFVCSTTADANATMEKVTPSVQYGDSPIWSPVTNSIYFVDRLLSRIHRLEVASKKFYTAKLNDCKALSFIVPIDGAPDTYAIGIGTMVGIYCWDGVSAGPLTASSTIPVGDGSDNIYSGKADPTGRLYVSMKNGFLYSIAPDRTVTEQMSVRGTFTGMAWDANKSAFYRLNCDLKKALKYTYSADTGAITPGCTEAFDFIGPSYSVTPNGLDVDADGNLWVGLIGATSILHIDPETEICLHTLDLPNVIGTASTFGDPGLDVVYVTTLNMDQAGTGALYRSAGTGIKGVADVAAKITV